MNPKEEQTKTHFRTPKLELRSCVIDTNDVAVDFRPPGGLANRQYSLKFFKKFLERDFRLFRIVFRELWML